MEKTCRNCTKIFVHLPGCFGIYCGNKCQQSFQSHQLVNKWKNGEDKGWVGNTRSIKKFIRNYLLNKHNNTCIKCGWNEKHPNDGLPLVEINHIDGNAENCKEDNLEVLCPNCHSKTSNFRRRNSSSTRNRKND